MRPILSREPYSVGAGIERFGRERISMRILLILPVALMILAASGAQAQATDPYQWVGFTTTTFDGSGNGFGFTLMTSACRADFGGGARMCKSSEYMDSDTLNPTGIPVEGAWLRPSWRPVTATTSGAGFTMALDESGVKSDPARLSCNGWISASSNSTGLALRGASGGFNPENCSQSRPVTCCKPTPVAEPSASLSLPVGAVCLAGLSMLKGGA